MKEFDWLTELIMQAFTENGNKYMTVCQIMNRVHGTHSGDSNDANYRPILRRVNKLHKAGYLHCKYVNPYVPAKYRFKDFPVN